MGTVGQTDLIRDTAAKTGLPQSAVKSALDALVAEIRGRAEAGDTVKLVGFGSFSVRARPARTGRNPATGEAMQIPESRKLHFKASPKALGD